MEFNEIIKKEMMNKNLKQTELARLLGVVQSEISNWINGKFLPTVKNAIKLSNILNIDLDILLKSMCEEE